MPQADGQVCGGTRQVVINPYVHDTLVIPIRVGVRFSQPGAKKQNPCNYNRSRAARVTSQCGRPTPPGRLHPLVAAYRAYSFPTHAEDGQSEKSRRDKAEMVPRRRNASLICRGQPMTMTLCHEDRNDSGRKKREVGRPEVGSVGKMKHRQRRIRNRRAMPHRQDPAGQKHPR
ncbi:hypothetical protein BT67DRAFT_229631 [Trichocladium antarcticum]|uniref:Uncharacterized protein n=1 Tax=Trichocladium antarcticum TaxID=1450529 RepID=A0AAN6ZFI3_9PEZI|nr:hypothetical protein BT67DRAFT_229631 [Trichocladium antarcticum]